jgi:hypothetical protein
VRLAGRQGEGDGQRLAEGAVPPTYEVHSTTDKRGSRVPRRCGHRPRAPSGAKGSRPASSQSAARGPHVNRVTR